MNQLKDGNIHHDATPLSRRGSSISLGCSAPLGALAVKRRSSSITTRLPSVDVELPSLSRSVAPPIESNRCHQTAASRSHSTSDTSTTSQPQTMIPLKIHQTLPRPRPRDTRSILSRIFANGSLHVMEYTKLHLRCNQVTEHSLAAVGLLEDSALRFGEQEALYEPAWFQPSEASVISSAFRRY